jgi:hypothetical protein
MLARKTGEAVWIGELVDDKVHIVHQAVRPDNPVQILDDNTALPWNACALGLAIAAGLDNAAQETLLGWPAQQLTGLTVTNPGDLRQILAMTRNRGYAIDAHTATLGEAGIAAPLFAPSGRVIGAIGIVGPAERLLSEELQKYLAEAVCSAARAVSQEVGSERAAANAAEASDVDPGPFATPRLTGPVGPSQGRPDAHAVEPERVLTPPPSERKLGEHYSGQPKSVSIPSSPRRS